MLFFTAQEVREGRMADQEVDFNNKKIQQKQQKKKKHRNKSNSNNSNNKTFVRIEVRKKFGCEEKLIESRDCYYTTTDGIIRSSRGGKPE